MLIDFWILINRLIGEREANVVNFIEYSSFMYSHSLGAVRKGERKH